MVPELLYKDDLVRLLKFKITPEDDGSDDIDGSSKKYEFDWDVTGFSKEESTIDFQLEFANADGISMGQEEDSISVDILDRKYF